jgi:hypothetical protein
MPGFPFPPAGPLGLGSPPSPVLWVAKTSTAPSRWLRFPSLPDTPGPSLSSLSIPADSHLCGPSQGASLTWTSLSHLISGECSGSPESPGHPCRCLLRSWTTVDPTSHHRSRCGLLPAGAPTPSAFSEPQRRRFSRLDHEARILVSPGTAPGSLRSTQGSLPACRWALAGWEFLTGSPARAPTG